MQKGSFLKCSCCLQAGPAMLTRSKLLCREREREKGEAAICKLNCWTVSDRSWQVRSASSHYTSLYWTVLHIPATFLPIHRIPCRSCFHHFLGNKICQQTGQPFQKLWPCEARKNMEKSWRMTNNAYWLLRVWFFWLECTVCQGVWGEGRIVRNSQTWKPRVDTTLDRHVEA